MPKNKEAEASVEVAEVENEATESTEAEAKNEEEQVDDEAVKEFIRDNVAKKVDKFLGGALNHVAKERSKIIDTSDEKKIDLDVDSIHKGLSDLKGGQRQSFAFDIKSKAELDYIAKSTSESGNLTDDVLEITRVPGVSRDPVRDGFLESIADTSPMNTESLSWVEVVTETGSPATTAELATIPEKDFEFQEFKTPAKKVTISNKHSVELLEDAPQLVNAIKGWLNTDLNLKVDEQLLSGDGTGANLTGVIGQATTLTAGSRPTMTSATIHDVLRIARTEIAKAGKGKFSATHILLNPDQVEEMDLQKDANNNYIIPPFRSADGQVISGATVVENTGIATGTFLIGDFTKLHVGVKGGVRIEMTNADGTDFSKDILTVKMVRRLASYVRANDSGAFYTGTVATIITDLTS